MSGSGPCARFTGGLIRETETHPGHTLNPNGAHSIMA